MEWMHLLVFQQFFYVGLCVLYRATLVVLCVTFILFRDFYLILNKVENLFNIRLLDDREWNQQFSSHYFAAEWYFAI